MIIKQLRDEDFTNYHLPSMVVGFPSCTFKCEKECGCKGMCQNGELATSPSINITYDEIINRYISNPISKAIVFGGLEPFDSETTLLELMFRFREKTNDPIVIYTGYYKEEISEYIYKSICKYIPNVIIKWGRYIPGQKPHYDDVLGVYLASDNQWAEKIS